MNTKVMFSSKTDLWETPQYLFDKLDSEFYFDVDVCALPDNAKCKWRKWQQKQRERLEALKDG